MDFAVFTAVNQLAGRWGLLDGLMTGLAKYGVVLMAIPLLLMWFRGDSKAKKAALLSMGAVGLAMIANQVIGHIYFRPRPFASHEVNLLVERSADPSFPSDHAAFVFAIAGVVVLKDRFAGYLSWMALAFAVLVSLSRVFIGTHYPLDVTGGCIVGSVAALGIWQARRLLDPVTSLLISIARRLKLA